MNKIYKVIWNYTLNTFVVVSELAKGCVKSSSSNNSSPSRFSQPFKLTLLSLLLGVSLPSEAYIAIGSVENNYLNSSGAEAADSNRGTYPLDYKNPGNKSYDRKDASIGNNYSNNSSFGIAIGKHSSAIVSRGDRRSNGIAIGDYSQATGGLSMALGSFAKAPQNGGVAIGAASLAQGFNSLSMMRQSAAIGDYSTAIGSVSWANGTASFALGASATAFGDQSIAIGSVSPKTLSSSGPGSVNKTKYDGFNRTQTNGNNSIAMGSAARTNGDNSFAIGSGAETGSFDEKQDSYLNDKVREANSGKRAEGAIAFGVQAKAKEAKAMAFGYAAQALKENAMAFGAQANASESNAMAFGSQANALKQNAMAFGSQANASQENAMAFGASSKALAGSAMAFGTNAEAKQNNAIAFGAQAKATEIQAIAIGFSANATQSSAVAIGSQTNALKDNTTAIGTTSKATQSNSTALGFGAQATHENSVALGANSTTDNVQKTSSGIINGVTHTFAGGNPIGTVSVGGGQNKERTITNVGAGRISSTSTDAINGSQLYAVKVELEKGWTLSTGKENDGEVSGNTPAKVKLGDTVTVKAGKNIKITQADKNITVATKEDVTFNKVDTQTLNVKGDTTVNNFTVKNGGNIDMGGNRVTNIGDPTNEKDAVNKKYVDNVEFNYKGDSGTGKNKLSTQTAFKGTANEIVTAATNGSVTFSLAKDVKDSLALAKSAVQSFTVGVGSASPNIPVDKTNKHFDIVGGSDYVTTSITDRKVKIDLSDNIKNVINDVTNNLITVTGGTAQANSFKISNGGSVKVISSPNDATNIITVGADTNQKAITVGVNSNSLNTFITNNPQVQANKNKIAALEPKVEGNTNKINALEPRVQNTEQEIATLKPQVTNNKNEIDALKPQVETNKQDIAALKPKVDKNTADIAAGWELTINDSINVKNVTPQNRIVNFKAGNNIEISKTDTNSVLIATSLTPKLTNATFGDNSDKTVINKDGITITNNGKSPVKLNDNGLDNGGNKIQNIANGTSPNDAVNMSQLDAVNATANAGWKLQVNKKSDSESVVTPNATVSLNNEDNNIQITKTAGDNNVTFALNTTLTLGKEGNNSDGKDGALTVKGKDGSSVVLNGKDGSIGLTGTAGADGLKPQTMIKVTKGQPDVNNTGSKNRITYTNGNNNSTEELATLNDGLKFKGDNDPVIKKKLNEQLEIIGGANKDKLSSNNIGVNENNGKLEIKLSKELSDLVSAEFGTGKDKTTINKDGITITNGDKNVSLTENGLNNGGNKISNIANGVDDSDAVNMSQLNAVNATANAGWTLFTNNNDATKSIIRPNSTVSLNNQDGNIQITKTANDGNVTFTLNPTLNLGSNDPKGEDGSLTVKGKDGSSVALNGKDGSISLTGQADPSGTTKPTTNIKVKNGSGDVNSPDKKTRITYTNGKNGSEEEVATLNDGLKFKGDTGTEIVKKLNETVTIKGNMVEADEVTDKNLRVDNNNGSLILKMAKSLKELANATFGADGDKTFINKDGISITNNGNTISLTDNGLNNGDKQITNVASGLGANTKLSDINDSDNKLKNAANIGDLKNAITDVVSGGFGLKDDNAQEVKQSLGTSIKVQGDGSVTTKVVEKNGNKALQVGLTNNVTVGDTTQPGTVTLKGKNGTDGITLNGKDGSIGLIGKNGVSTNIAVANGPNTLDGQPNTNTTPRITYTNNGQTEHVATTNDGLIFGANVGNEHKAKLNSKVHVKGAETNADWTLFDQGKNLMTNMDNGTIRIGLAKDLTALNSATFTETTNPAAKSVVNGKGLTITPADNNKQTVSLTDAGLNNGGNKITNVGSGLGTQSLENASGDTLTNAVNVQDLKNAITKTVGESGWNLQTNNDTPTKVGHNNTVQFINGENIEITRPAGSRDITISTSKDLNVNTVKAGKKASGTDVGTDGAVTAEGKDGSSVALNGKDGSIGVSNKGQDGASANITVKQGKPDVNGQPNTKKTRITYQPTDQDGTPQGAPEEVATLKDGLKFKGDKGTEIVKQLNETLTIKGNIADTVDVTDKNLRVDSDGTDLILKMAKSLQDLNDITFGDKNSNDKSFINKDGLTITNNGNTVKLTENGLDNGGHQVTNVGSGLLNKADGSSVALKDAANDMLKNAANIGDLQNAVKDLTGTDKGGFGLKDETGGEVKQELGKSIAIKGDESLVTKVNATDKSLEISLNNKITVGDATNPGSVTIKGNNDKDAIALNGQDGTIKLKDANGGDRVSLNGNDGSIDLTGKDGVNGTLTFAKGNSHIDGTVGTKETTRISYTPNGSTTPEFVATLNDGLKFGANTGTVRNAKLNDQINVMGHVSNTEWAKFDEGKNIMTSITDGTITVGLAKALIDLESVTFNKGKNGATPTATTSINSNGLTITPNNNNNQANKAVSLTDNGLNNGGNKITNVDKGEVSATSTDAVNGAQLHEVKETANAGWNLSVNNTNSSNVKPTNTIDLSNSDGNLVISKVVENDKHKVGFKLGDNLNIKDSLTVGPKDTNGQPTEGAVIIGKDGRDGKNNEKTIALVGKDGKDAVSIKGKDGVGTIGLTGKAGQDGTSTSAELSIAEGAKGLDGNDRQNSENKTRIVYKKPDGKSEEVATLNDGLIFAGNDGTLINRKLNTKLNILGGITEKTDLTDKNKVSSNNLGVRWKDADSLEIVMKERPTFSGLVLNGKDGQAANIKFEGKDGTPGMSLEGATKDGGPALTLKNKDGADGVSFTNDGRITNVADGKDGKDAVNVDQLNKAKEDLVNKGFGIKAQDGNAVNKSLGDTVEIVGADSNISTKVDGDKVKIELAKTINLGDDGSVTAGKTVLNKDGVKVGDKVALTEEGLKVGDKVKVTESGLKVGDKVNITEAGITVGDVVINKDTGINAGNKAITNVADGDISATSKEAVNGSQLFKEAAKAKTEVEAGENIVVTPRDGANGQKIYTVATKKDVSFDNVKVGDISINKNDGINAGNKKISNVADGKIGEGSKEAVNGHQLFTEAAKAKSEVKAGTNVASVTTGTGDKGQTIYTVNADGTTVSAGSDKVTVTKGTKDINNVTDYKVDLAQATKDDIAKGVDAKTQVDKGINFAGGDGKSTNYKLGDTITIAGDSNLTTETTDKGVTVKLNKDINLNSVSANTFKAGGVTISADSGINAGGKQITHVASGLVDKNGNKVHIRNVSGDTLNNAVNVGDLKTVAGDIYNNIDTTNKRVDKLDKRVRGIGANSAAAASLPQVYIPGKSMVAASAGGYGGEAAVALGYSRASDNGKVILKLTGTANSAGHYSGGVGVGYQW